MSFVLFDTTKTRQDLLPLTFIRPIADCRVGILTIREKWELALNANSSSLTEPYLSIKYPYTFNQTNTLFINGAILPNTSLIEAVNSLKEDEVLTKDQRILAFRTAKAQLNYENLEAIVHSFHKVLFEETLLQINFAYDIFKQNGEAIAQDFQILTKGKKSQPLSATNQLLGDLSQLFIEEGASIECSILNTKTGPIYIGKDAEIMEGSIVRGPFALCDHAGLKMAAKIYGPTTIGPHCKVGGEVNNCVFFAYSNKGHDGFLGNSVVAEWCNLGADTNTSNLKNNYGEVDVWNYREAKYVETGMQFHGLVMGDHAKAGINTMFNTGTVVGVSANIFGGDFPPKFIPSFTWGGAKWLRTFIFEKGLEVAEKMMERRNIKLTQVDIDILKAVYEQDEKFRKDK